MRSSHTGGPAGAPLPRPGQGRSVSREDRETRQYVRKVVKASRVPERDLEDIVQNVMLAAVRSAHRFQVPDGCVPAEAWSAWLRGIAQRCVAHSRRQQARHRSLDLRAEVPSGDWHGRGAAPTAEEVTLALADVALLHEGLAHLGEVVPEILAVLVAYELEEQPMDEIAASLGIPLNTAWNRLRLAREALRAHVRRGEGRASAIFCAQEDAP